jgi:BioD-like phosphotransacetylase family protein
MKPIYISATVQDSGKTCVTLGLMQVLQELGITPGYCKPVGQHYVRYKDKNIDEDSVLMHKVFNMQDKPYYLSPIAIERGFTTKFIFDPNVAPLEKEIVDCKNYLTDLHPMVIYEGTGHAGVGSCFGLSNARVAELLGSEVVIVTAGGIGRPIDEIALSMALFQKHNVNVMGVILNKVLPSKYDKVKKTVAKGLENLGTKLLGAIPYDPTLSHFTMGQLAEEFKYDVMCGHDSLSNVIEKSVVAAMEPQNVFKHITDNTLVICPGDRVDNILVTLIVLSKYFFNRGGLILTGGFEPDPKIITLLKSSSIPILTTDKDTFTVSSRMADLGFKIRSYDSNKISKLHAMVKDNVDIDYIMSQLKK